jgi:hypothetical protein
MHNGRGFTSIPAGEDQGGRCSGHFSITRSVTDKFIKRCSVGPARISYKIRFLWSLFLNLFKLSNATKSSTRCFGSETERTWWTCVRTITIYQESDDITIFSKRKKTRTDKLIMSLARNSHGFLQKKKTTQYNCWEALIGVGRLAAI